MDPALNFRCVDLLPPDSFPAFCEPLAIEDYGLQAEAFTKAVAITALAITKLDGTARGGIVLGIVDQLKVPVKYLGIGEGTTDLQAFDSRLFVKTLFGKK